MAEEEPGGLSGLETPLRSGSCGVADWESAALLRRCLPSGGQEAEVFPFRKSRTAIPELDDGLQEGILSAGPGGPFWPPHRLAGGALPGVPEQPRAPFWSVLLPHGRRLRHEQL